MHQRWSATTARISLYVCKLFLKLSLSISPRFPLSKPFVVIDVFRNRVKGMFLKPTVVGENRRVVEDSLWKATGGLLAHVSAAISFLEEWLKADYPFLRCTHVSGCRFLHLTLSGFLVFVLIRSTGRDPSRVLRCL